MAKRSCPLSRVYGLLEPGPVVLVTAARKGQANVMPLSWHTMMEFEPSLAGCVISGRNASFDTLRSTRECVINIPSQPRMPGGRCPAGQSLQLLHPRGDEGMGRHRGQAAADLAPSR